MQDKKLAAAHFKHLSKIHGDEWKAEIESLMEKMKKR